jgi:hypothetical protein
MVPKTEILKQGRYFIFLILLSAACSHQEKSVNQPLHVNFDHLQKLTETIALNNKHCSIIHIYAEYPDYEWVDANNEGIACVDDAARAAVLYLRDYELSRTDSSLGRAKSMLNFIFFMQADDGEFYNFIDENLQINQTGKTSEKSFGHWAARGYWALGLGYRIFRDVESEYAHELKNAFLKCKSPIEKLLENYPNYTTIAGRKYPLWLIHQFASDATATLLLGVIEYLKVEEDEQLTDAAQKLAKGILAMQVNDESQFNGAFLSWPDICHAWGNAQSEALAALGKLLDQQNLIQGAQKEADHYFKFLLVNSVVNEWQFSDRNNIKVFPQIAYGIRCIVLGLLRLHQATGDVNYAQQAGLFATWFFGNNAAQTVMYDSQTGRCFDGINDSSKTNLNAGAESTIEALLTVQAICQDPMARKYAMFTHSGIKIIENSAEPKYKLRIFRNSENEVIQVKPD